MLISTPQNNLCPLYFDRFHSLCHAHFQKCIDRHCVLQCQYLQIFELPVTHHFQYQKGCVRLPGLAGVSFDTFLLISQSHEAEYPTPLLYFPIPVIFLQDNNQSPDSHQRLIHSPYYMPSISLKKLLICSYAFPRKNCLCSSVNVPQKSHCCAKR